MSAKDPDIRPPPRSMSGSQPKPSEADVARLLTKQMTSAPKTDIASLLTGALTALSESARAGLNLLERVATQIELAVKEARAARKAVEQKEVTTLALARDMPCRASVGLSAAFDLYGTSTASGQKITEFPPGMKVYWRAGEGTIVFVKDSVEVSVPATQGFFKWWVV